MALFSYRVNALLHVCNECFVCNPERYRKLIGKDMITDAHKVIMKSLNKYRFLTLDLMSHMLGVDPDPLRDDLGKLEAYGLVIRQYYKYSCDGEAYRSPVFYSLSPHLPFEFNTEEKKIGCAPWHKELSMAEAMSTLNFNYFHSILKALIPRKAFQAQTNYKVGNLTVNGRYKLKSSKFTRGYSHCIVLSIVDFAEDNKELSKKMKYILDYFEGKMEKLPWFIVLCETSLQASFLTDKIVSEIGDRSEFYFILSSDLDYSENPFHVIQDIRREKAEIISRNLILEDWY